MGYVVLDDLQNGHKTFDFFDRSTGHAVSAKTMDTLGLTCAAAVWRPASRCAERLAHRRAAGQELRAARCRAAGRPACRHRGRLTVALAYPG
ncbi:endonuclease toxin domain-containing protein [Verminephrobacter aporrectodeae]